MPRAFDSDAKPILRDCEHCDPEHPVLVFTEILTCPACAAEFEGEFVAEAATDVEDIDTPPQGVHECPFCQWTWTSSMTGWTVYSEAG